MTLRNGLILLLLIGLCLIPSLLPRSGAKAIPDHRTEVVFWHFWGGTDRDVVEDVASRFNESQTEYWVRPVAMPGNNMQAKLFLAVAGGDPPDLVNQDDPILADWGERGIIRPIEEIGGDEVRQVEQWMFDSARRLSSYNGKLYGVCNGLDIRALFYNRTALEQYGFSPPTTLAELDQIAETITPKPSEDRYAYLPDSRRLWAWGFVHGGDFLNAQTNEVEVDSRQIEEALSWMQSYSRKYGPDNLAAFRQGDQSLPGKTFPLLPIENDQMIGRYVLVMDGQWRVRDIVSFRNHRISKGIPCPEFGVCALPVPESGRSRAGWVNGNFFVVPKGAKNGKGAWEFMKFWIGFERADEAAKTCAAGGWIPVSEKVANATAFQAYLDEQPLFRDLVELAASPNQFPIPQVPGAAFFKREVESAGYRAINEPDSQVIDILNETETRIQQQLDRVQAELRQRGQQ